MARDIKTTQADPTAPRPVDPDGRQRDDWGLPLNGPARARALGLAGKPDPRDDPAAWAPAPVSATPPQD
ncbi:hypothetical protein [Sphingomonas sp. DC2300-3]|uniref:hypothetical protein n=1 Tax=unclassified Sphingomonas TaxID=196159 RepID=UPI003ABEF3A0